jgi:putative membrane protein
MMEFFFLFIAILLGCIAGSITGLTPGLHINLVATIMLGSLGFLLKFAGILPIALFIIAMSITHTFTDFISSTYLGVPTEETALAVMPAHRMVLQGMAHEAVKLSVIGSLLCLIITIMISPMLIFAVPFIFESLKGYVGWILLAVLVFMISREENLKKKLWCLFVTLISGALGIIALGMPNLNDPLLPMLSGLFGVSMLLFSIGENSKIPQQTNESAKIEKKETAKALGAGVISGSIVSIFPGLGPAQAGVIASQLTGKMKENHYLILVGGIGTVSMILSFITLLTIGKARNGSIAVVHEMIGQVNLTVILLFFAASLAAAGIAAFLSLKISRTFSKFMNRVNYRMTSIAIIALILSLVIFFSGWIGLIILLTATAMGIIPNIVDIGKSTSMACLLVPIILYNLL